MARTRSQTNKVNIPIVKLEEHDYGPEKMDIPSQSSHKKQRKRKKPKFNTYIPFTNTSMLQKSTKRKLESLKPKYKYCSKTLDKQSFPNHIENINGTMTSKLIDMEHLQQQLETINQFRVIKNFDIDIRTVKILTSNIEKYNTHDLKLLEILRESHDLSKLYELYNIEQPIITETAPISNDSDDIPFL